MGPADRSQPYSVLFLCTANSARSIIAESLLNYWGNPRFAGFSAGSFPRGEVNPQAIAILSSSGLPVNGLRSKSWSEFAADGAPAMDFVITVCDNAAGEVCPVWPGQPLTAHWGIPDPAAVEGTKAEQLDAFRDALKALERRIKMLIELPLESLDSRALRSAIDEIGRM